MREFEPRRLRLFFLFVDVVASLLRCFASSSSVVWRESILSGIALGKKSSSSE